MDRKRWESLADSEAHQIGKREPDKSAEQAKRRRFNQELQQDRAAPRAERFARSNFFRALFHAYKGDVHDPNRADEQRQAGDETVRRSQLSSSSDRACS